MCGISWATPEASSPTRANFSASTRSRWARSRSCAIRLNARASAPISSSLRTGTGRGVAGPRVRPPSAAVSSESGRTTRPAPSAASPNAATSASPVASSSRSRSAREGASAPSRGSTTSTRNCGNSRPSDARPRIKPALASTTESDPPAGAPRAAAAIAASERFECGERAPASVSPVALQTMMSAVTPCAASSRRTMRVTSVRRPQSRSATSSPSVRAGSSGSGMGVAITSRGELPLASGRGPRRPPPPGDEGSPNAPTRRGSLEATTPPAASTTS